MADGVSTLFPTPRLRVQGMKEYHPPLGSREAMRLDFNENTLECSPRVRETLAQISAGSLTRYPEREPVEAIVAAHLGLRAEQVVLTNGVDEAIHVLFEAFLEAGDELLLPLFGAPGGETFDQSVRERLIFGHFGEFQRGIPRRVLGIVDRRLGRNPTREHVLSDLLADFLRGGTGRPVGKVFLLRRGDGGESND